MPTSLRISVRFLQREYHGRGDGGEPEWPPSPLRLFQALTNAAARLHGSGIGERESAALRSLEELEQTPEIFAPKAWPTNGYQLFVPDNVGDLVAKAWCRGDEDASIAGFRTAKQVRPLRLAGDAVHYVWRLGAAETAGFSVERETLLAIARATTRLGWGIDLVVAEAAFEEDGTFESTHATERWLAVTSPGGSALRVPVSGTLNDLNARHVAFLGRLQTKADGSQYFRPVPPLSAFRVQTYRREAELTQPPYAVFALRELDDARFATFDPQWRRLHLSGMLRHAASRPDLAVRLGWDQAKVSAFVLGHDKSDPQHSKPTANAPRLVFIPLPSIEQRGQQGSVVGAIRRVLVTVSGDCDPREFRRIAQMLEGQELFDERTSHPVAFLRRLPGAEYAVQSYFSASAVWTTVTPVVLPGHDDPRKLRQRLRESARPLSVAEKEQLLDKLDARIDRLLRKAFLEAGLPKTLVADAELQWRGAGYLPGVDLASRYSTPDQCRRLRRLHVRVTWNQRTAEGLSPLKLPGPFCIGSGRFSGLGLFAATS